MSAECPENDETGRLMRAIAALSAAPEPVGPFGRRLIAEPASSINLLNALLAEVNETVLRRTLTFAGQGSSVLKLDVKERRIVQVVSLENASASTFPHCSSRTLTHEDADEILQLLCTFCESAGRLTVLSNLPDVQQLDVYGGVSCGDLEACLGKRDAKPALQADALAAMELTKEYAVALLSVERDNRIERWGSEVRCTSLERLLPVLQEATGTAEVRVWPEGLRDNLALLTARQSDLLFLALVPRANATVCFAHWHDVIIGVDL